MPQLPSSPLQNWIPYRLLEEGKEEYARWLYLEQQPFIDPFFDETIAKCRKFPENSRLHRCVSSLDFLPSSIYQLETVKPTAIIFHISRCGSTLISQLLSLDPGNIVLSEVPLFDELLRNGFKKNKMETVPEVLAPAISLYGQKRNRTENALYIKTDSWHIHFYSLWRKLYPGTPFILLYRQPGEVIRSQQKRRGMQSVQGVIEPGIFQFNPESIMKLSLDEYMGRVIESYLAAFLEVLEKDVNSFAFNYNEGILNIVDQILLLSGKRADPELHDQMKSRTVFHAKYPGEIFSEPPLEQPVPGYLEKANFLYESLEIKRDKRHS